MTADSTYLLSTISSRPPLEHPGYGCPEFLDRPAQRMLRGIGHRVWAGLFFPSRRALRRRSNARQITLQICRRMRCPNGGWSPWVVIEPAPLPVLVDDMLRKTGILVGEPSLIRLPDLGGEQRVTALRAGYRSFRVGRD